MSLFRKFSFSILAALCLSAPFAGPGGPTALAQEPHAAYDPLSEWCHDALARLRNSRLHARDAASIGDSDRALNHLIDGMRDALRGGSDPGLFTARALRRGLQLARALESGLDQSRFSTRTLVHFFFAYYDFIEGVAMDLDLPYALPYRNCRRCGDPGYEARFEENFIRYAQRQIAVVLDTLAETYQGRVTPVGPAQGYLTALKFAASASASDLRESIWGNRYSCQILSLESLSRDLDSYLAGRGPYRGDIQAVGHSYQQARNVLSELYHGANCGWPRNGIGG